MWTLLGVIIIIVLIIACWFFVEDEGYHVAMAIIDGIIGIIVFFMAMYSNNPIIFVSLIFFFMAYLHGMALEYSGTTWIAFKDFVKKVKILISKIMAKKVK